MITTRCPKTRKVRFRDKLDADMALAGRRRKDKGEIRSYRCLDCKGWHLTSMKTKRGRKL